MHRIALSFISAAALCAGVVQAQISSSVPVAAPTTPAPTVVAAPTQTPSGTSVTAPAQTRFSQIVYTPRLPTPTEVTNAAAAQGLTVERIVQTATQVVAFYRNAAGQTITVAYQSLPPSAAATTPAPAVAATSPAPVVVNVAPPPAVYETAPRVIYYDYPDYYYYPRGYYPPVSFGFGFGYRSFYGGHFGHRR